MKLTVFLITAAFLNVSAKGVSQNVTFSGRDVPLEKVFTEVKRQTGYFILYSKEVLDKSKPVDVSAENMPLSEFLDIIFKNQPLSYVIDSRTINVSPYIADQRTDSSGKISFLQLLNNPPVTGRITDTEGKPLSGINISIKGTKTGTVTDAEGKFNLNAKAEDVLVITGIGYSRKEIKVGDQSELSIQLQIQATTLDTAAVEIVNTGYQKIPKERATGSFDFIDNKKFNEQVSANVLDRLEGIASGLSIDRTGTAFSENHKTGITIRGLSTINGSRDPLIVIDNFPYDGDLSNINPNNVENITILKDAAAASIWGAKAGNGVIVITTKQGKFGQRMKVSANVNASVTQKPDLFSLKIMSPGDFVDFEKYLFDNHYYDNQEQDTYNHPALSPVVEILIRERDNLLSTKDANSQLDSIKGHDIRNDYEKYMYQPAVHKQAAVSVTGGTNNTAYSLFAGYDKDISNLNANGQRINLSSTNTFKPIKNLDITAGVNFTKSDNNSGRLAYGSGGAYGYGTLPPYTRLADDQGNALPVNVYRKAFIDTFGQGKLMDWNYYPLNDWKYSHGKNNQTDFVVNTSLSYQLIEGLKLGFDYKYEKQQLSSPTLWDQQSFYTRNLINKFTQFPADGSSPVYIVPFGDILSPVETEISSNQLRGRLNFDKSWNRHNLSMFVSGDASSTIIASHTGNNVFGYDPDNLTNIPVDIVNYYPLVINQSLVPIVSDYESFSKRTSRLLSLEGSASYTYNNKYVLSISARRDGSNIFGATTNNKWKPLWSVGLSWNIAKENFYHSSAIPFLKLRATYGYQGNLSQDAVGVLTLSHVIDYIQHLPRYSIVTYNNPSIRWENVATTNIGIDFGTAKNIVSGSLEYFHKKTSDLFGATPIDYTTIPASSLFQNVASTAGDGVDVHIVTKNINRNVKWSTTLNASWYKDRTISYYLNTPRAGSFVSGATISPGSRHAIYGIYAYQWAGLDPQTGDPQGYLDGKVSTDYSGIANDDPNTVKYFGAASPTLYGSIENYLEWNRFSVSVNILYRLGYYFHRNSISYDAITSAGIGSADYDKRWMKPGDEQHTNVPSLAINKNYRDNFYNRSSILVDKGDQVRLNYIRLNYALQPAWLNSLGLSALNIYFNASNLGIIWKANKDGVDPDYRDNITSFKVPKVMSFGLNASF